MRKMSFHLVNRKPRELARSNGKEENSRHLLRHRTSSEGPNLSSEARSIGGIKFVSKASDTAVMLLSYDEIPEWYQENPYIRRGYRPVSCSTLTCLWSWTYLHNESMNIYSHLVPSVAVIVGGPVMYCLFNQQYPLAPSVDHIILVFFLLSLIACFGLSVGYHTLISHSNYVAGWAVRCDYVGILILTMGDFVSGIRMSFFCEPTLRNIYWAMVSRKASTTSPTVRYSFEEKG